VPVGRWLGWRYADELEAQRACAPLDRLRVRWLRLHRECLHGRSLECQNYLAELLTGFQALMSFACLLERPDNIDYRLEVSLEHE